MANKKYWEDRSINTILESEMSVLDFEAKMQKAYNVAIIALRKEINAFFGKYAVDNKVTLQEARRRLSTIDVATFKEQLNEWYKQANELGLSKEYKNYIKLLADRVYVSRLQHLEASIRFEAEKLATTKFNSITELVENNYLAAYYKTYHTISTGLAMDVSYAAVNRVGLETAIKTRWEGRNYSDSVWQHKDKLVQTMERILPQSFARGLSSNALGDMIAKELQVDRNRGRTLARTEVNYLANQATLSVYIRVGLLKYGYLATLDLRTSDICRSLNGKIFLVVKAQVGVNYPPMHPNCRSTTIPYLPDEKDVEDRVARDETGQTIKVPRNMTQEQWIKKYAPKEQQERLLRFLKKYKV